MTVFSAAAFAITAIARAQAPAGWPSFVKTFDAYVDSDRVVGASMLVMKNGVVLARHDVGQADRAASGPVNDRTI